MLIWVLLCTTLSFAELDAPSAPPADPLPLRRIALPPERVAAELERAKQGVFVKLAREEFEARVARAVKAGQAAQNPPRLLEARYRCSLTESGLVGSAQWTFLNPGATASVFPLPAFSLALRGARFEQAEAVLGELDGKTLGVLLEQPGKQQLALEWSARGDRRPTGIQFPLRIPACALQSFELELPAEHVPFVAREAGLVTGPESAEIPGRQVWRIDCAGQSQIDLVIRHTASRAETPLVLARVTTEQTLAPGAVEVLFKVQLDVLQGSVRELRCFCDAELQPYRVTASEREVESWEPVRSTPGGPLELLIRLREPVSAGPLTVTLSGLAPLTARLPGAKAPSSSIPWTCPGLRVAGTVPRGETLVLRVPPEVQLADWNAGRFTLASASVDTAGRQVLTLHGQGGEDPPKEPAKPKPMTAPPVVRPQARLRIQGPEFQARQQVWWQLGAAEQALTAQIHFQVTHGKLYRLQVLIPPWEVESVDLQCRMDGHDLKTADLVRTWTTEAGDAQPRTLLIDLLRGLGPTAPAQLTVRLRHVVPRSAPLTGPVNFPVVAVRGARWQEGALGISVVPTYQASTKTLQPEVPPETQLQELAPFLGPVPLWGTELPDFLYVFHGQPVTGTLLLLPRHAQLQAQCRSQVLVRNGGVVVVTEVQVQPLAGQPRELHLRLSAPVAVPSAWKTLSGTNQVRQVERLGTGADNLWRLALAQPLRGPLTLQTTLDLASQRQVWNSSGAVAFLSARSGLAALAHAAAVASCFPRTAAETRWDIPLPTIQSAERHDGEVAVILPGNASLEVEARGLTEVPVGTYTGEASPRKLYRYQQAPLALSVRSGTSPPDQSPDAVVEQVRLTTTVLRDELLIHHVRGRIWDWRQRTLPLHLPAGTQLLAVKRDGRWLPGLALVEAAGGGVVLEIPVAGSAAVHDLELVYTTRFSSGWFCMNLEAPLPVFPVTPLAVRRTWRLPPDLRPLREQTYLRLPGPTPGTTAHGLPLSPARPEDTEAETWLLAPWRRSGEARWIVQQRQELAAAATRAWEALRGVPERRLGQLLHTLAFDAARGQDPVLIDTVAFRRAGLGVATRLPAELPALADPSRAFAWEGLGLVHLPCRPAALLTTVRQADAWQAATGTAAEFADSLAEAVAEAARQGRDASGRFHRAADWLREIEETGGTDTLPRPALTRELSASLAASFGGDWTEWEPLTDDRAAATLTIVRQNVLPGLALVLTGGVLVGAWGIRHWPGRRRGWLLLLGLAVGVLSLIWLPPVLRLLAFWPTLALGLVAGVWYLGTLLAPEPIPAPPSGSGSVLRAAVLLLTLTGTLFGQGEAMAPSTVWLLPDSAGAPGRGGVLVPPALLDELEQLSRRGVAALGGSVLLDARYEGQAAPTGAELTAEFRVWSFAEETTDFTLPLTGVALQEMLLDGAPAFPTVPAAPQTGYVLKVKGRGAHVLRVRFTAQVQQVGGEHELKFTVPRLTRSRLQLHLHEPAAGLHAVLGPNSGVQQVTTEGSVTQLDADLGRTSTLHVRWRSEQGTPKPPLLEVREAYVWHLRTTGSRLQGVLRWTVKHGPVTELRLDLPDGLEVYQVDAVSVAQETPAPRLANTRVEKTGSRRRLRLEFQGPLTSSVQVNLELVPTHALTAVAALALPVPEGNSSQVGHLAVNVDGLDATVTGATEHLRVLADRADFVNAWKSLGQTDPGPLPFRYSFRRGRDAGPVLRLLLNLAPARVQVVQDLTWHVGQGQSHLRAVAQLTAARGEELILVEWEVPGGFTVADVRGPHLRSWMPAPGRVQVWLQRTARETPLQETSLELTGWQNRAEKDTAFTNPPVRIRAAQQPTTFLRVVAAEGMTVEPTNVRTLLPLPEPRPASRERSYFARDDKTTGTFLVRPASTGVRAQVLTMVEVREQRLHFVSTIDYQLGSRELRTVTLRLHNWDNPEVQVEADRVASRREYSRGPERHGWVLDLQPGVTGSYRLQLSGSRPLDGAGVLAAPDVSVAHVPVERWLLMAGPELAAEGVRGLKLLTDPHVALAPWDAAAEHFRRAGGSVWKLESADWQVLLRARPAGSAAGTGYVVWSEHALGRPDGRRWLCDSTWWFYQEAAGELRLHLPPGTVPLTLTLDGRELPLVVADTARLALPAPGGSPLRTLRVRWAGKAAELPPDGPRLTLPQLEGAVEGPAFWTVYLPAGYTAQPPGNVIATSAAVLELSRAAALLPLVQTLGEQVEANRASLAAQTLQTVQERFYRCCRHAERLLNHPEALRGAGPRGQDPAEWAQELREQNRQLAQEYEFDRLRQRAERRAHTLADPGEGPDAAPASRLRPDLLTERGLPVYWVVPSNQTELTPRLDSNRDGGLWQAVLLSLLVLAGLGMAGWLANRPDLASWLQRLWPEQLAATGLLVWLAFGWLLPGLLLLTTSAGVRLYLFGRWAATRLQANSSAASQASSFRGV